MKYATLTVVSLLSACMTVSEDTKGSFYSYNGDTVVIRGQYAPTKGGAKPTQAMVAQAKGICPNATFLSGTPSNLHQYDYTFQYLFKC